RGGPSCELCAQNHGRFAVVFYQSIGPHVVTQAASSLAYNAGKWHYVVGILRSGLAELHVDGVLLGQDVTGAITTVRPSTLTEIGHVASYFIGAIDEIRAFSRALTALELVSLMVGSTQVVHNSLANPFP